MLPDRFGAHDAANEQAVPTMSGTEPEAAPNSAPTSPRDPPLDLAKTPDSNPTPERSPVASSRTDRLERHILPLLIPPVLLLVITAIVVTLGRNLFGSTFFTLTGFHGTHVAIGVFWLASLVTHSFRGRLHQQHALLVEIAGLYWHFVDIVWILIFTLVYLIPD